MARIEDLLHRRTDLSTFLVHFTRDDQAISARTRLLSIVIQGALRKGRALGMAARPVEFLKGTQPAFYESQRVVCFTETPLEHAWMMCESIDGRAISFSPYGLAFTKTWGRLSGINPVWYLDISARGIDWLTKPINSLVTTALEQGGCAHDIFKITPYIEQMGPIGIGRKEFWCEREWRLAGRDLTFRPQELVALLVPMNDHRGFLADLEAFRAQAGWREDYFGDLRMLDATWGLERMVASLAGVPDNLAGPWPYPRP